jgi:hypothetical protein
MRQKNRNLEVIDRVSDSVRSPKMPVIQYYGRFACSVLYKDLMYQKNSRL